MLQKPRGRNIPLTTQVALPPSLTLGCRVEAPAEVPSTEASAPKPPPPADSKPRVGFSPLPGQEEEEGGEEAAAEGAEGACEPQAQPLALEEEGTPPSLKPLRGVVRKKKKKQAVKGPPAAAAVATVNVGQDDASDTLQDAPDLRDASEPAPGLQAVPSEAPSDPGLQQASELLRPVELALTELASSEATPDPNCDGGRDDGDGADESGGWAVSALREVDSQGGEGDAAWTSQQGVLRDEATAADRLQGEVLSAGDPSGGAEAASDDMRGEAAAGDPSGGAEAASDVLQGGEECAPPRAGDWSGQEGGREGAEGGALPSQGGGEGRASSSPSQLASSSHDDCTAESVMSCPLASVVTTAVIPAAAAAISISDEPTASPHLVLPLHEHSLPVAAPSDDGPLAAITPDPHSPPPSIFSPVIAGGGDDYGHIPSAPLPLASCLPTVTITSGSSAAREPTDSTGPQPDLNRHPTESTDPEPAGVRLESFLQPAPRLQHHGSRDEDMPVSVRGSFRGGRGQP